ncbi:MAG: D-alanyl-D-alanine carboxypeptidase/D-alanyl-D-alanine endopeptidase [Stackebrandtia sp.]
MAISVEVNPGAQSDTPQEGKRSTPPARSERRSLAVTAAAAAFIGAVAIVVPFLKPADAAEASLEWPEQRLPEASPVLPGADADAPPADPASVAAAIDPLLQNSALEGDLAVSVLDGFTGEELYSHNDAQSLTPASSTKVVTAVSVLATRGAGYRIPTRIVAGASPGEVMLVAGGDVTMSSDGDGFYRNAAQLSDLADQAKKALGDTQITQLTVDTSVFSGELTSPGVDSSDVAGGYTADLTPVMIDGGRVDPNGPESPAKRHEDPVFAATSALAEHLGLGADAYVEYGEADPNAEELGVVHSPPMQQLLEYALDESDNVLTDALARQAALASDRPGTFEDAAAAAQEVLDSLEVPTDGVSLVDGSGLSGKNRLTARALAGALQQAASPDHPELSGVFAGLPVAGYSGTLGDRYEGENADGVGVVRAKTGTLNKVSSLTGAVVDADGRLLMFSVILNDRGDQYAAQDAIDAVAVALSRCGCG